MTGTPPEPRATLTADYQRDWPEYFEAVKDQPPRDTAVRALAACEKEDADNERAGKAVGAFPQPLPGRKGRKRIALDIACGEGRDTRAMLERGWRVIAVDYHAEAVKRTVAALTPQWAERCEVRRLAMEEIAGDAALARACAGERDGQSGDLDIVNASFALPFCDPEKFPALWSWIAATLRTGGRFAGQFFGDRDDWRCVRPKSHVTRAQLLELLSGYEIEHLDEVEKDGSDAMGGVKHHHVFHVVGRKLG